jgi:hypothetical protein
MRSTSGRCTPQSNATSCYRSSPASVPVTVSICEEAILRRCGIKPGGVRRPFNELLPAVKIVCVALFLEQIHKQPYST